MVQLNSLQATHGAAAKTTGDREFSGIGAGAVLMDNFHLEFIGRDTALQGMRNFRGPRLSQRDDPAFSEMILENH